MSDTESANTNNVRTDVSLWNDEELTRFTDGKHFDLQTQLGAHPMTSDDGVSGCYFAVWAPNAKSVSVIGDFNDWKKGRHNLVSRGASEGTSAPVIWEGFVPGVFDCAMYKFHIVSIVDDYAVDKADPFGRHHQVSPDTASIVVSDEHSWNDQQWMDTRSDRNQLDSPMSIYEVHLGSWRRVADEAGRSLTYRELADQLVDHVKPLGFTHVEFLPAMEHPYFPSWGYQTTGYFAPSSRYGSPDDFRYLIDCLHQHGIGVILDWVPSHFPGDEHGLANFDGTHLFEYEDPREGFHPDWNSYIYNYARPEVRAFLISNALFWLKEFHVDGLRVDAVASMLYRDYSRKPGEWIPNVHGGRENLEAIEFLRELNTEVYTRHPDVQTIAEESTAWPNVSRPVFDGGLGFGLKWDMGWNHDTLKYMREESFNRRYHHHELVFRMQYAFNENYVIPLSHDEVVHGKGSLLEMMPGDQWQKFANLRALYGYMFGLPGKKLLFMGDEFAQQDEWDHDKSLQWDLLKDPAHAAMQKWIGHLNQTYATEPALHQLDCNPDGFEWIDANASDQSVFSFLRKSKTTDELIAVVLNFAASPREHYGVGVPRGGYWREILNSDAEEFGGSGRGNGGGIDASSNSMHGRSHSVSMTLPPLGAVFLKSDG